jgi:magnesium transporter
VITGLFGMNVLFPGEGTAWMFWVIIALMVAAIVGMLGLFRYKRWL